MNINKGRLRVELIHSGKYKYIKLIGEFTDRCFAKLKLTEYQSQRAFQTIVDSRFMEQERIEVYEEKIRKLKKRIETLEMKDRVDKNDWKSSII